MAVEPVDPQVARANLQRALTAGEIEPARDGLRALAPDDAVELLDDLPPPELTAAASLLGDEAIAELLDSAEPTAAARLIVRLGRDRAADVLEEMAPDHAVDLVEELEADDAAAILVEMESPEAGVLRDLMVYPPNSAGGRMTPDFAAVAVELTVDAALGDLRRLAAEAETIYYVYTVDGDGRLVGVLSLRDLVLARPGTRVSDVMVRQPVRVRADADQEVAARLLADRGLLALPVVDADERLLGIITADDATDILRQEAGEDIEQLGGARPLEEPYATASPLTLARKRVGWLLLLFVAEAYTGTVLRAFEDELQAVVALTFFIPLLIGTGGNTGSQTVTTVIRAMATGEVGFGDLLRVWRKEVATGLVLGAILSIAAFARSWTLGVGPNIGLVVALTAGAICLWAATVAAILPLILRRLGVDPAVVSAPLITTLVDGTGLVIYFEIARRVLAL